jgi:hypothetical protein
MFLNLCQVSTTLVSCASVLVAYVMLSNTREEKTWAIREFTREMLG